MATREENLKKINEELEKLDDEELEKIAGGMLVRQMPDSDLEKFMTYDPDQTRFYKKL